MQSPRALENVLGWLAPGGRIGVTGAKWASWWALPVNAVVWLVSFRFVTTFDGFGEPWRYLQELVPDLEVHPLMLGGAYLAWGTKPR